MERGIIDIERPPEEWEVLVQEAQADLSEPDSGTPEPSEPASHERFGEIPLDRLTDAFNHVRHKQPRR